MSQPTADRNLLFGILALQMDFITREQLIAAMQAWVFDKNKTLGEILSTQKALADDSRQLLEALVQKHLAMHGNDPEKSLAAVSSVSNLKQHFANITDPDVQASIVHVAARRHEPDPFMTIAPPPAETLAGAGLRFRILRPHAKGGLGEVFIARDEELNREVALKEIHSRQADHADSRARFLLEAEVTGGLEHPGIVPVYGLGTYADGRPYYAMRFIRGDNLKEAIEQFHKEGRGTRDEGRALELRKLLGRFIDVCQAIAYAHSRGVLHRDLKPGNIMLGKYGETLVVDWGLAKALGSTEQKEATEPGEGSLRPSSLSAGSQTIAGSAMGTPQYMSPEQAAGRWDQLGPTSDVYSLGATLFCLLTGRPPIVDGDVGTVLLKVQRGDFPRPRQVKPEVPPALEAICLKAMALKAEDRYASPLALANDVEHWLADEPVSAWREPWTAKARRFLGRHRTLATGVAAAVLVALVGLVAATLLLSAANERERLAKQNAELNFQLARLAVDRYHTEVSESILLHEPGQAPLRKKLLEAAREYYAQFVKEHGDNPAVRGELARATYRLAQITGDIDSQLKAIELHEQAVKQFGTPTTPAGRSDLAACYHHLGRLYRLTDQTAKSEEAYGNALKVWKQLVEDHPKEERYQAGLARTRLGLGNEYQLTRRIEQARTSYQQALETLVARPNAKAAENLRDLSVTLNNLALVSDTPAEKIKRLHEAHQIQKHLAGEAPHISQYQDDLARNHYNLAVLHAQAGATGEAEKSYVEAVKVRKELVRRHPDVIDFSSNLAGAQIALAMLYRSPKDLAKAEAIAEEAVTIQRKLVAQQAAPNYQGELGRGLYALGQIHFNAGEREKAEAAYQEAVRVLEKPARELPGVPHYRKALASSYTGLGRLHTQTKAEPAKKAVTLWEFEKALAEWEKLVKDYPTEQEYAAGLSTTCFHLGQLARVNTNDKEAIGWYTRALNGLDAADGRNRTALGNAHWMRAETLTAAGRAAEALADWDRAVALARDEQKPAIQLPRAAALARAGKHAEAAKEASLLLPQATGAAKYRFAVVYALCAASAGDKELAGQYAAEAIRLLSEAGPIDRKKWISDPDLQSLRALPGFKKLIAK